MTDNLETENQQPEDDKIVGKAITISALALVVVGAVVGGVWYFNQEPPPPPPKPAEETKMAEVREKPELKFPTLPFKDITQAAGIDFVHTNGAAGAKLLPETMGGGGAFFDFDNDGDQDILCVNSQAWPDAKTTNEDAPTSALYANDGNGNFTNVTTGSGLDVSLYGTGIACGDYDNDGLVDVYLTAIGPNRLFHNDGGGKFTEVTDSLNASGGEKDWGTSCGWFDFDRDGDLDLLVCNYLEWSIEKDSAFGFTLTGDLRGYGRPTDFRGVFPTLLRNDGTTFTDVSEAAGLHVVTPGASTKEPLAKSLGLVFPDVNADGWPDVVIANDTVQNLLLVNKQDGTFEECGDSCGVAFGNDGQTRGAMGTDVGCFRNDDAMAIAIGNYANEMTGLYVCQTPGFPEPIFRDEAVSNGVGPVTRIQLTFGVLFGDFDLDGRLDIFSCNGHLEEDIQAVQSSQHYRQSPQLLWNCGPEYDTEFVPLEETSVTADFTNPMVGRGAARADIDGDGDLDLLLFAAGESPRLLRNDQQTGNDWLRFTIRRKDNQSAIGTVVRLTLKDGQVLTREVMPTCSYQSQSELPLSFGLGQDSVIDKAEVVVPGKEPQPIEIGELNRVIELEL